jgi:hypothetical protein
MKNEIANTIKEIYTLSTLGYWLLLMLTNVQVTVGDVDEVGELGLVAEEKQEYKTTIN